ncbi:type VI secretion system-associated protein TagF, partial [Pyxidicoccus sp. 3LFB2]
SEGERPGCCSAWGRPPLPSSWPWPSPAVRAQVWPLRTERPAAIDNARKGFKAAARQVIDAPTTTLEQLLRALAP